MALLVGALFVMAPAQFEMDRAVAPAGVDKEELYAASLSEEFGRMASAAGEVIAEQRAVQRAHQQLVVNGGWTGEAMPWTGAGTYTVASGAEAAPEGRSRTVTVLVRVEDSIPVDAAVFAQDVMRILNDPRGWGPVDNLGFARTDVDAEADIVLTLASPATTEQLCGELPTHGYTSCGRGRPVNINGDRWTKGAEAFMAAGGSINEYRAYVINHEVGHSIGHGHESCPAAGAPAPVMQQQTLGVGACVPNGWPNPGG